MDNGPVKHVVIVGGGTSGWLAAGFLSRLFGPKTLERLRVTLVESQDIGIIGVGEATIPTLKRTLRRLDIDELHFMRNVNATCKLGIRFENWHEAPGDNPNEFFWHPFGRLPLVRNITAASHWLKQREKAKPLPFAECFSVYPGLSARKKSPRRRENKPYEGAAAYAYHIDATLFGHYLRQVVKERGVNHIVDKVTAVEQDERGYIDHLILENNEPLYGDLFIDCSGFRAMLAEGTMGIRHVSYADSLLCDRAIAIPVPWPEEGPSEINPYTTATALDAGWAWDIPLQSRRGRGYVYSARHATEEQAEAEFRRVIGDEDGALPARHLKMKVGRLERHWEKNCIALGLSGGFVEPLESTAIYMVEMGLQLLALNFPDKSFNADKQKNYNNAMGNLYDHILDFIVYHYCITDREDTGFWKDNKHGLKIPDTLAHLMALWQTKVPTLFDFTATVPLFSYISYTYIMAGHDAWPKGQLADFDHIDSDDGARGYLLVQNSLKRAARRLPDHARYINWLHSDAADLPARIVDQTIGNADWMFDPLGRNEA